MTKHQLVIELPENVSLPEGIRQDQALLRNALAVMLYKLGQLSLEQARKLMGLSRREFEETLPDYGVTMMDERDFAAERDAASDPCLPKAVASDGRNFTAEQGATRKFSRPEDGYGMLVCRQPGERRLSDFNSRPE